MHMTATLYPCISVYWQLLAQVAPGPGDYYRVMGVGCSWLHPTGLTAPAPPPRAGCSSALTFALQMVLRPLNVVTFKLVHTYMCCKLLAVSDYVQASGLLNKRHVIVYVHRPIRCPLPVLQTLTKLGTRDES